MVVVVVLGFLGSRDYDLRDKPCRFLRKTLRLKIFKGGGFLHGIFTNNDYFNNLHICRYSWMYVHLKKLKMAIEN